MNRQRSNEDQMLIASAKTGNLEAFESLVRKYQQSIYCLCRRMTGAHQSADDLAQETFLKAFSSLHTFKEGMSFFSWIRRIAVNSTLNFLKIRKREKSLDDVQNPEAVPLSHSNPDSPQERLEKHRMEEKFRNSLQALPSEQRIVFVLKVYENQSYEEISRLLNIPHGTVMSRLSRAREKLKIEMAEFIGGGIQ